MVAEYGRDNALDLQRELQLVKLKHDSLLLQCHPLEYISFIVNVKLVFDR